MNWAFCRFGLIVTGTGERDFLPQLFDCLCQYANCHTTVIRKIGQRSPISSPKRILRMTGTGRVIPDKDVEEIGLPARRFVLANEMNFVLVVDDLEYDRQPEAGAVFDRYRLALDTILTTPALRQRSAVHFLTNMLEAYYFGHCAAANAVARRQVLPKDHSQDVEQIRHPKNELKGLWSEFDEVEHGKQIVKQLDVNHVLSRPGECCWLRAMFAWCIAKLNFAGAVYDLRLNTAFSLPDGCQASLTSNQ